MGRTESRWGIEGPPEEAYERVTNPERFRPLHAAADALLQRLEKDFDVERAEAYDLDPDAKSFDLSRPSIRLTPRDPGAAPIIISFSRFPGILVRFGRWAKEVFPSCGCDACDEDAEDQIERFEQLVENVSAGRMREAIRVPWFGAAREMLELWGSTPSGHSTGGWRQIERDDALKRTGGKRHAAVDWKPWPRRASR